MSDPRAYVKINPEQPDKVKVIIEGPTCSTFNVLTRDEAHILATLIMENLVELMYLYRVWHNGRWIIPFGRPCDRNERECLNAARHGKRVERQFISEWHEVWWTG